jgi:hypothetical protein
VSDEPVAGARDAFTVVCQRSGITVDIGRSDGILDVLKARGISLC